MTADSQETPKPPASKGFHAVGTALLVIGSAFFGGLAVVLWNRKTLAGLRHPPPPQASSSPDVDDTE